MSDYGNKLFAACLSLDVSELAKFLEEGADINKTENHGESVFSLVIGDLAGQEDSRKYEIIKFLLDRGADPNLLDEDRCGPLTYAMLNMDEELIDLLCRYGARPNDVAGFSERETLYDWAEFDYQYNVYGLNFPEKPTEEDLKDENSWLNFLQGLAEKYNFRKPSHLFVLRKYGARSWRELYG